MGFIREKCCLSSKSSKPFREFSRTIPHIVFLLIAIVRPDNNIGTLYNCVMYLYRVTIVESMAVFWVDQTVRIFSDPMEPVQLQSDVSSLLFFLPYEEETLVCRQQGQFQYSGLACLNTNFFLKYCPTNAGSLNPQPLVYDN